MKLYHYTNQFAAILILADRHILPQGLWRQLVWFTSSIQCDPTILTGEGSYREYAERYGLFRFGIDLDLPHPPIGRWLDDPKHDSAMGRCLDYTGMMLGSNPSDWWLSNEPIPVTIASCEELVGGVFVPAKLRKPSKRRLLRMRRDHEAAQIRWAEEARVAAEID